MSDSATLQVPNDVIEPIIRQHVASAVAEALKGRDELVTKCVHQVLNIRVDRDGKPSSYQSNTEPTWLQHVMQQCVREAVKEALQEELGKHKELLKAAIVADLKSSRGKLAKQLAEGMVKALTHEGETRRDGHSALRFSDGQLGTFDPNPSAEMQESWIQAAAEEIHDALDGIEGEAGQAAQVEQDMEAGFHVWREKVMGIIRKHWNGASNAAQ